MTDHNQGTEVTGIISTEIFEATAPQVRLPGMSHIQGNAWAQMKAREKNAHDVEPDSVAVPRLPLPPRPTGNNVRKFSGLDYDQDLAVPMPKPRSRTLPKSSPPSSPVPESPRLPNKLTKSTQAAKKHVTVEAARVEIIDSSKDKDKDSEKEKKKSRVAALKSKFSLTNLGKEFWKDPAAPPLPTISRVETTPKEETRESEDESKTFDKVRLYVPKPRDPNIVPLSAPPKLSVPRDHSLDALSDRGASSCPLMSPDGNDSGKTLAQEKLSKVSSLDMPLAPHTAQHINIGQPQIVEATQRISSMKVVREPKTPPQASSVALPLPNPTPVVYSPSVYGDTTNRAQDGAETSPCEIKSHKKFPLIVSSHQPSSASLRSPNTTQFSLTPAAAAFTPTQYASAESLRSFVHREHSSIPVPHVTGHGGYAPPPPHPGYQNTMNLEQQMAAHADSIHHHIDSAINKLIRTFENGNNWTIDQVLRQFDGMSEIARALNNHSMNEAKTIREITSLMMDLRTQMSTLQRQTYEIYEMEGKVMSSFHREIEDLRRDISKWQMHPSPGHYAQGRTWSPELQGTHDGHGPNTPDRRPYRIPQHPLMRSANTEPAITSNKAENGDHVQERHPAPVNAPIAPAGLRAPSAQICGIRSPQSQPQIAHHGTIHTAQPISDSPGRNTTVKTSHTHPAVISAAVSAANNVSTKDISKSQDTESKEGSVSTEKPKKSNWILRSKQNGAGRAGRLNRSPKSKDKDKDKNKDKVSSSSKPEKQAVASVPTSKTTPLNILPPGHDKEKDMDIARPLKGEDSPNPIPPAMQTRMDNMAMPMTTSQTQYRPVVSPPIPMPVPAFLSHHVHPLRSTQSLQEIGARARPSYVVNANPQSTGSPTPPPHPYLGASSGWRGPQYHQYQNNSYHQQYQYDRYHNHTIANPDNGHGHDDMNFRKQGKGTASRPTPPPPQPRFSPQENTNANANANTIHQSPLARERERDAGGSGNGSRRAAFTRDGVSVSQLDQAYGYGDANGNGDEVGSAAGLASPTPIPTVGLNSNVNMHAHGFENGEGSFEGRNK